MDVQFKPLKSDINKMDINLNIVSNDEHVPPVERYTITVKGIVRCGKTTLPFKKIPRKITSEVVVESAFGIEKPKNPGIFT